MSLDKAMKPITRVYVRTMPFEIKNERIYPPSRVEEIEACTNEKVRAHKYYVWKLLEFALEDTFGMKIENINARKEGMRWVCDGYYFSLSHSEKCVAVALSNYPVGIDIQLVREVTNISPRILCKGEKGDNLLEIFSKKEAIFKSLGREVFSPSLIDTGDSDVASEILSIQGEQYILSVACKFREYKQINMFDI